MLGTLTFRFFTVFVKNCFTVYKYPIKLPLSTVETYLGFNGSKVRVLYQLYKCPFHFCNFCIVMIIVHNFFENYLTYLHYNISALYVIYVSYILYVQYLKVLLNFFNVKFVEISSKVGRFGRQ